MTTVQPTRRSWMLRSVLLSLAVLVPASLVALAQAPAEDHSLNRLRQALHSGDKVTVTEVNGDSWQGRIVRVGPADVEIAIKAPHVEGGTHATNMAIPWTAIDALDRPRDSSQNGLLIGASVGAGFGLTMFAYAFAVDRNEMDEWGSGYALGIAVTTGTGALVGWAIDTVHSRPVLRYRAERTRGTQVSAGPLLSGGKGVAVKVTF